MQQWIKWSEKVRAPIRNRSLVHWFSVSVTAWSSRQVTTAWKFEIYTKKSVSDDDSATGYLQLFSVNQDKQYYKLSSTVDILVTVP